MKKPWYFDGKTDKLSMRQEVLLTVVKDKHRRHIERCNLREKNALVLIQLDGYIHSIATDSEDSQKRYLDYLGFAIGDLIRIEERIHSAYSDKEKN